MCSEQTWTKIYADHFKKNKNKILSSNYPKQVSDYSTSGCDQKYLDMESYSAQQRKVFKNFSYFKDLYRDKIIEKRTEKGNN